MIDGIIIAAYLLLTLVLGIWAARNVTSPEEYKTGGRKYSSWVVFATLSASFIGGGFTIGLAEKSFLFGIAYPLAMLGFSLKEVLVAKFIAPRMKAFKDAMTVGDIMVKAYGSKARFISGVASVLVCSGIIGAQILACGNILYTLLGTPIIYGSLITAGIVVIYATYGGMKSVVAVDILHFSILIIMLPLVLVFALSDIGGVTELISGVPESHLSPIESIGWISVFLLFLSFFLGETLIPPYVQRLLIGKTTADTKQGTLFSGLLSVPFFLMIGSIGMCAYVLNSDLQPNLALPHVINTVMPVGLKGLAIAGLLAVVMSSADSFLNSTAIAMTNDVLAPLGFKAKNPKDELLFSRGITFAIGLLAIVFALNTTSVLDLLLYSYQFWTPFILVPLLAAIFQVRSSDRTFLVSALVGISSVVWWNLTFPQSRIDGALESVIFGISMNSITFWLCHKYIFAKTAPLVQESRV
jgi:SSS family solute:Na+ symporter